MPYVPINYIAVFFAGILNMVVGFLWYGPLFGNKWKTFVGMTDKKMEEAKKRGMQTVFGLSFAASLITAYVLAHLVDYTLSSTFWDGMQVGFWAWLGFTATALLVHHMYSPDKKPWMLYAVDSGYHLAGMTLMGGLLAVWI